MLVSLLLSLKLTFFPVIHRCFFILAISVTNELSLISGRGLKICARARTVLTPGPLTFKMLPAPMLLIHEPIMFQSTLQLSELIANSKGL